MTGVGLGSFQPSSGSLFGSAMAYIQKYGLEAEAAYPSAASGSSACRYDPKDVAVRVGSVGHHGTNSTGQRVAPPLTAAVDVVGGL